MPKRKSFPLREKTVLCQTLLSDKNQETVKGFAHILRKTVPPLHDKKQESVNRSLQGHRVLGLVSGHLAR
jgi:hypothetical protein